MFSAADEQSKPRTVDLAENVDGRVEITHPVHLPVDVVPTKRYDMHGNVLEWCSDWYGEYPKGAVSDPGGPDEGSERVERGGYFGGGAEFCRSAFRHGRVPSYRGCHGFRVALSSRSGIPQSPEADK
jgi:formylglycine-generating enzyme required for sulfatase activity